MSIAPSPTGREGARLTPASIARPSRAELWIVSGPFSLRALIFWGIVVFVIGFLHGRQMSNLARGGTGAPAAQTPSLPAFAPPGPAAVSAPQTVQAPREVTIHMLKFSPERLEVKVGAKVEWANTDLTPHTVTSPDERELNSGSISAGASWQHVFSQPGTFAYFCTFHPEMKGTIIVR